MGREPISASRVSILSVRSRIARPNLKLPNCSAASSSRKCTGGSGKATRFRCFAITTANASASARSGRNTASASSPLNVARSEEHTSELQSLRHLVCRLLLEKKKRIQKVSKTDYKHKNIKYLNQAHNNS